MIWYRAEHINNKIYPVEVIRETDKNIVLNVAGIAKMVSKSSRYLSYYPTFKEAKKCLEALCLEELCRARFLLQKAQARYGNAKGLKETTYNGEGLSDGDRAGHTGRH